MGIVERVAAAISASMDEDFPAFTAQKWADLSLPAKQSMMKRASAAIEALRDPGEEPQHRQAYRAVERTDGAGVVVLDEHDRSVIRVVDGTPCFPPEVAAIVVAALNKVAAHRRAREEFEGRDPYHGEFY